MQVRNQATFRRSSPLGRESMTVAPSFKRVQHALLSIAIQLCCPLQNGQCRPMPPSPLYPLLLKSTGITPLPDSCMGAPTRGRKALCTPVQRPGTAKCSMRSWFCLLASRALCFALQITNTVLAREALGNV